MCGAVQLVPLCIWRMGHDRDVSTLATLWVAKGVTEIKRSWVLNHAWRHEEICSSWWRNKMEYFPRYWPFVSGIHRSPVNSPHKGQWRGALVFSVICASIKGWVHNREAGDLRRHRAHYDIIVMDNAIDRRRSFHSHNNKNIFCGKTQGAFKSQWPLNVSPFRQDEFVIDWTGVWQYNIAPSGQKNRLTHGLGYGTTLEISTRHLLWYVKNNQVTF